jgi:AmmeMemoRadiSam system protein A
MDEDRRKHLLAVARDAIAARLGLPPANPGRIPDPTREPAQPMFVTLSKDGTLRGCIGHTDPSGTLEETVAACAVSAATTDPRFPPLDPSEFPQVHHEISILSPPRPITDPRSIQVGTHGVIVSQGNSRAVLLPQVAAGRGWTAEAFLAAACHKAGLRPDAWLLGASVEVFTAEVFGEDD